MDHGPNQSSELVGMAHKDTVRLMLDAQPMLEYELFFSSVKRNVAEKYWDLFAKPESEQV